MALLIPKVAELLMLQMIVGQSKTQELLLSLYSNAKKPAESDDVSDYDEVTGFGYQPVILQSELWDIKIDMGKATIASYPEQVFIFNGAAGNVYGYFVTQNLSGKLLWAERFDDAPYKIQNDGDSIKLRLVLVR